MSRAKVVVLGSNFGGLTAALAVKHELHGDVDVTVISPAERFLFTPSLIWLPFGKRAPEDISFPVEPTLAAHGIDFVPAPAFHIDPVRKVVDTGPARCSYDYLVIATGYRNRFDVIPGLGPGGNAHLRGNPPHHETPRAEASEASNASLPRTRACRHPGAYRRGSPSR